MFAKVNRPKWYIASSIIMMGCIIACLFFSQTNRADAYGLLSDTPQRKAVITVAYTTYEWWLLTWNDSSLICQVFIEHEGLPEAAEVEHFCGAQVKNDWLNTPACAFSDEITRADQCPGFYLHLISITPGERQIEVDLLPPEVFIEVAGCTLTPPENRCSTVPELHFIGIEPLPNESIINIQGYIGAEPFSCQGSQCSVPIPSTGQNGIPVTFWADSSFGDSTEGYTAQVRVIPWGDFGAPEGPSEDQPQWYVDILSSQYLGETHSTCSQIWSSFPPVGGPSQWLSSPIHPDGLFSESPYYYLAGTLIRDGQVDASSCPVGGLEDTGYANQCGLETARPLINEWQNQFNSEIIRVSQDTGVPSQLLKNIFSRESQFWPGFSATYKEAGLGHLSDLGADTVLLWNPSFFTQFCPLALDTTRCQKGFGNLDISEQEMLRGALVQKVNAACPECPLGIDLRQANFSISIFARSILANCEQVGQIYYNETRLPAGHVSSYEDLWRFTLVNYNAGPGCLSSAIQLAILNNYPLTWDNVSQFLEPGACQLSIDYVNSIADMPQSVESAIAMQTQEHNDVPAPNEESEFEASVFSPDPAEEGYPVEDSANPEAYP